MHCCEIGEEEEEEVDGIGKNSSSPPDDGDCDDTGVCCVGKCCGKP